MAISMEITSATSVAAAPGVVSCELDGETVLLDSASSTYFGLDPIGSEIWNAIQHARTVAEIRDLLTESYDVQPGECEKSVVRLVGDLASHGLVTISRYEAAA